MEEERIETMELVEKIQEGRQTNEYRRKIVNDKSI